MRTPSDLAKIVNGSGFPLQIAVERAVQQTAARWGVLHREHAWLHGNGQSGFADLVIANDQNCVMVIECKRVRESDWVFITNEEPEKTIDSRIFINNTKGHGKEHHGYFDLQSSPSSFESDYCVMAGQDAKSRPLLERIAYDVATATEAVAQEEQPHAVARSYGFRCYVGVVVTTARLSVCAIDPSEISIIDGEATNQSISEVPWIRFRKQLSHELAVPPENLEWSFSGISKAKEKVTFVVNAGNLVKFLNKWGLITQSLSALRRDG
jgi:hypothetical protein